MLDAMFVVHLDDYHGFIVEKRYPTTLSLNEKILNLVYTNHLKEGVSLGSALSLGSLFFSRSDFSLSIESLELSDAEDFKIVSLMSKLHPEWMVCFVIGKEDNPETMRKEVTGMSRLILKLITSNPDDVNLEEILRNRSILPEPTEEQKLAEVFVTPSTSLLLERLQTQGVESAVKLSLWLKNEIQSDTVDIQEAVAPLLRSSIVKVEIIGKSRETVFLMKDIFCYRAPPAESLTNAQESHPEIIESYTDAIKTFFSPPPPDKGYNPTLPVDDPNSPIVEDREQIAKLLAHSLHYIVLECLRRGPLSIEELSEKTSLPRNVVQNSLWALESERVTMFFETDKVWALLTNPMIESFLPEYVLPLVSAKIIDKEINKEAATRYLELLENAWSEN